MLLSRAGSHKWHRTQRVPERQRLLPLPLAVSSVSVLSVSTNEPRNEPGRAVPPNIATEVKTSILAACRRVAAASSEEDSSNRSGDNVSPFEQSVIEEIVRALQAS
jgi:hypothetical protein